MSTTDPPGILTTGGTIVDIDTVQPYPGNARTGNHTTISDSLNEHGQYRCIVAQKSTGYILAGNNAYHVARKLGMTKIAVEYVDVTDEKALRINLVDNKANDQSGYDNRLLAELLSELEDFTGTGYDPQDLDALASLLQDSEKAASENSDDENILNDTDKAGWPTITTQVHPDTYDRFRRIEARDDATRIETLLNKAESTWQ